MFRRLETDRRRASLGVVVIVLGGLLIGCVGPRDAATVHVAATALPAPIATPIALLPPSPDVELPPTAAAATATATQTAVPVLPTETPIDLPATPLLSLEAPTFKLAPVADGLDRPLFVTHGDDGSGRLFIVEKPGTVRILAEGRLVERPFLDIRDRIGSGGSEQGLLGLAFAPDYDRTGHFYVNYTDRRGDTVVARYQVSEDNSLADPASETVVLKLGQPAGNHNGGMLAFGPDGLFGSEPATAAGQTTATATARIPGPCSGRCFGLTSRAILARPTQCQRITPG